MCQTTTGDEYFSIKRHLYVKLDKTVKNKQKIKHSVLHAAQYSKCEHTDEKCMNQSVSYYSGPSNHNYRKIH